MIVDELVNDGSFRVIERKRLDAILAEQNFSNSDRADPSAKTMAQIGKVLGVKYLVVGSITKFGTEKSQKSFSGGGYGSAFGLGSVGTSKGKANVAITARIIDISTAEIMAAPRARARRSAVACCSAAAAVAVAAVASAVCRWARRSSARRSSARRPSWPSRTRPLSWLRRRAASNSSRSSLRSIFGAGSANCWWLLRRFCFFR